jgi:hypothetical protein
LLVKVRELGLNRRNAQDHLSSVPRRHHPTDDEIGDTATETATDTATDATESSSSGTSSDTARLHTGNLGGLMGADTIDNTCTNWTSTVSNFGSIWGRATTSGRSGARAPLLLDVAALLLPAVGM